MVLHGLLVCITVCDCAWLLFNVRVRCVWFIVGRRRRVLLCVYLGSACCVCLCGIVINCVCVLFVIYRVELYVCV